MTGTQRLGNLVHAIVPQRDKPTDLGGPIPWLRIEDFNGKYLSTSKSGQGVSVDQVVSMPLRIFPARTVVTSCSCTMGATAIATADIITNQTFIGLVPDERKLTSDFLYWLLQGRREELQAQATGAIQQYLSKDDFKALRVWVPSAGTQRQISEFLDRETGQIDALIAKQEQLVETLTERRRAVIAQAVTRGLDVDVELVASGLASIGLVPVRWSVTTLRYLITGIESGVSVNAIDVAAEPGEVGVLKTSCVHGGEFDSRQNKAVNAAEVRLVACPVRKGSLIVSRMNTPALVGAVGYVRSDVPDVYLPDRLWQVRVNCDPQFLHAWMQTPQYRDQISLLAVGTSSSMQNLSQGSFRSVRLAVPPDAEQARIVRHIHQATATIDALTAKARKMTAVLRERRQALISAAVTGKIDVRGL